MPETGLLRRRIAAVSAVLGTFAVFISCATSSGSLPAPEELAAQGVIAADADLDALRRGRALAVTECATCHRFYWPHEYAPAAWPGIIRAMGKRASLSDAQTEEVEGYFVAASRAAKSGGGSELRRQEPPG